MPRDGKATRTRILDAAQTLLQDADTRKALLVTPHVDATGAVALLDHMGEQADNDAAVQRVGVPRAVGDGCGHEGVAVAIVGEEGLVFCHGG